MDKESGCPARAARASQLPSPKCRVLRLSGGMAAEASASLRPAVAKRPASQGQCTDSTNTGRNKHSDLAATYPQH